MQGYVQIKVKEFNENVLKFKVIDTGVGIQSGTIKNLGEKAYETHNQQGLNSKGIGLGLFICKKIIQQLGPNESFDIKSIPNKKTSFSFKISYKQQEKSRIQSTCKIFKEKGQMVRLNSAPVISGTLQFNRKKQKQPITKENQQFGLEIIEENFYDFNAGIGTKQVINDEIDDLRKGLLGVQTEKSEKQKSEAEQPDFLLQNFNWAAVTLKKNRSLSDEVQLMNDEIKDSYSDCEFHQFNKNSKFVVNTFQQIMIPTKSDIDEFKSETIQEIQQIRIKSPYYFKDKNIQQKDFVRKQRSPKQVKQLSKQFTQINMSNSSAQTQISLLNILIADDDPFNLLILSQYLEKLKSDYKVSVKKAYHGGQAVNIFLELNNEISNNNLNYIILDCQMPIMDGYNASQMIKEKIEKENYVNAVVIGYTAEIGEEVEEKCKNVNMDGYILKPASEKQFLDYLLSYLN